MATERYDYLSFLREKFNKMGREYDRITLKYFKDEKTLEDLKKQFQSLEGGIAYLKRIKNEWILHCKETKNIKPEQIEVNED